MKKSAKTVVEKFRDEIVPEFDEWLKIKLAQDLTALSTTELLIELDERIEKGRTLSLILTQGLEGDTTVEQNTMLYQIARSNGTHRDFIDKYGYRAVGEMELANNRWWEEINHKGMMKMGMLPPPEGVAIWKISGAASKEPYKMQFIYKGETYDMDIQIGQKTYSTTLKIYPLGGPVVASEVVLKEQKMFGIVPGVPIAFHMPPWMLAYLIIVLSLYPLNKHVFKIY